MNKLIIIVTILCLSKTEVKSQEPNFKINCINLFKEYPFNPNDKDKLNSVKKTISKESVFNLVQAYFPETDTLEN